MLSMTTHDFRVDPLCSLRWWMNTVREELQVINRDLSSVITREREGYYIQQRQLDSMQCQIRETQQTLTELEINVQGLHYRLTRVECHLQEVLRTARCLAADLVQEVRDTQTADTQPFEVHNPYKSRRT